MVKTHRRQRQDQMFNSPTQLSKQKHTQKKRRASMQALVLKIPVASNGTDDGCIVTAGSQLHPSVRVLHPSEARFLLSWSGSGNGCRIGERRRRRSNEVEERRRWHRASPMRFCSLCSGVRRRLTSVSESSVAPFPVISKACLSPFSE